MTDWVEVTRGGHVESRHLVHAAVVDDSGRLRWTVGDPKQRAFLRSAAKPFQALPLVEDGVASALDFTRAELALCCASHSSESKHIEGARALLGKAGVRESDLECGPHLPFEEGSAHALIRSGVPPQAIHNNCSGKHAGMLALARHHGWPTAGYSKADHPVQQRMLHEVGRWSGVPEAEIERGVDGCGVVCFALPLERMAYAFARFSASAARGESPSAVVEAMASHPDLVAGTGRLDTALMQTAGDRLVTKTGAEGVYGGLLRGEGVGFAIKVEDGGGRASDVALVRVLESLGVLNEQDVLSLSDFQESPLRNSCGDLVGEVRAAFSLTPAQGPIT